MIIVLGFFQYKRLDQGLMNSRTTFQRVVNGILGDMRDVDVKAYMEDLRIGSDDTEKHIDDVKELLKRLLNAWMRIKWSKCSFGPKEAELLGHNVSYNSILPSDAHVNELAEF